MGELNRGLDLRGILDDGLVQLLASIEWFVTVNLTFVLVAFQIHKMS